MNPHDEDEAAPVPGLVGYSLDQAPGRDLWPGIAARLPARPSRLRRSLGYAAAATVLVGLSSHLALNLGRPGESVSASPAATLAVAPRSRTPMRENDRNRALVYANLKLVSDAERALQQALRDAPESRSLERLLASTRARKRDLDRLLAPAI